MARHGMDQGGCGPAAADTAAVRRGADGLRRVEARELLGGDREVLILHGGQAYRLRATASGKLILTK